MFPQSSKKKKSSSKGLRVGGVVIPAYAAYGYGYTMGGMSVVGNEESSAHEANETAAQEAAENSPSTSSTTSLASDGGAAGGAAQGGTGGM
jgi:hypothetical protein